MNPDETVVTKEKQAELAKAIAAIEAQTPLGNPASGLRCPKCGSQMAHYRLYGYRCLRGCQ